MRGGNDRIAGQHPVLQPGGPAGEAARSVPDLQDLIAGVAQATDMVAVHAMVLRLAAMPGVRTAAIAASGTGHPTPAPAEVVRPIGPARLRLELRVAFTDPGRYARLGPVVDELASAAARALQRPCPPLAQLPGPQPPAMVAALVRSARELIVLVDPARGWIPLSDAFGGTLGYDRGTPPPGGLLDLVHPDDHAAAVASFVAACAGRHPVDPVDLRLLSADGRWLTIEVAARSFALEPAGVAVAYYGTDVTEVRAAQWQASLNGTRLAALADALPDGVLVLAGDGRIALVNDACRRLLCLERSAATTGSDWVTLLNALRRVLADPATGVERLRGLRAGAQAVTGVCLEFLDGRILELDCTPLAGAGGRIGELLRVRDITARVAAVRGLAAATDGADRTHAEASAMNSEFVALVAHELRGPLSSVVAFSCLLDDPSSGMLTGEQRGHLEVIDRNANRLLRLIDDLLTLSRLESRTVRLELAPVRLADLLGAALTEYGPAATAVGIELRRDLGQGPELHGDAPRLYQVIKNLIANALHFTPRGGRVTVRSRFAGTGWTVEVVDTGVGIPAADLPKLFSAFFRGSNVTSAVGRHARPGTGLGLLVCRAVAELHGGAIQVASTEGIGTAVTLTLPVGPERTSEVDRESAAGC